MTTDLEAIGRDLHLALGQRVQTRRRRRRIRRLAGIGLSVAAVFSTVAIASGIDGDLSLDPTKWTFLGGGSVDSGRGVYVHATSKQDGSHSTFLLEHDSDLTPYKAFLLHEKTLAAAESTSPVAIRTEAGDICSPAALTRAEVVALATLHGQFAPGSSANATKGAVDGAVAAAFAGTPCRGLEYAGEQARLVYAGRQPATRLMPGARE